MPRHVYDLTRLTNRKLALAMLATTLLVTLPHEAAAGVIELSPVRDIWTTSFYSYDGVNHSSGIGGGLNDEGLRVGGWGDEYRSLLQFDLSVVSKPVTKATLDLFHIGSADSRHTPVGMKLDRVTSDWDWTNNDLDARTLDKNRLWWDDRPTFENISTLPAPTVMSSYSVDITNIINGQLNGTYDNYGIQLRPTSTWATFNYFASSEHATEAWRPKLILETEPLAPTPPQYTPPPPPIVVPIITEDIVSSKPTVVITHGWQPVGTPGTTPVWMTRMEDAIGTAANVVIKTWDTAFTGFFGFQDALAEVALQGRALGRQLLEMAKQEGSQVLDHLHFIGHSLGTYVNAYAADFLTRAGYTVEEFTILDRPFGNGLAARGVDGVPIENGSGFDTPIFQQLLQKDKVLWVENYYGNNTFAVPPAFGASFAGEGPTAFNWLISDASHTEVHHWYACTMGVQDYNCGELISGPHEVITGVGYHWSLSSSRFNFRPEILWDPGTYLRVPFEIALDPVEWIQINCQTELGVARCAEGSPAFLWKEELFIPLDAEFLQFDFRWVNLGDGDYLSVFFDDTLLFNDLGLEFFGEEFMTSGLIPIGDFSGITGRLLFALNSVGESNAVFDIANIEILRHSVPEPGTLLLVGIGFAALIAKRYRRKF